jgi:hypothetical protein
VNTNSNYVQARDSAKEIVRLEALKARGETVLNGFDLDALLAVQHRNLQATGLGPKR